MSSDLYMSDRIYKIGYTTNLRKRLAVMNVGRLKHDRLQIVRSVFVRKKCHSFEREIHRALQRYRLNGEFFKGSCRVFYNKIKQLNNF